MADTGASQNITLFDVVAGCAGIATTGGLCVPLGLQIIGYLRAGHWVPFSAVDAMALFSDSSWLRSPDDWIGIHRMLGAIHGGLFMMVVAGAVGLALLAALALLPDRTAPAQVRR